MVGLRTWFDAHAIQGDDVGVSSHREHDPRLFPNHSRRVVVFFGRALHDNSRIRIKRPKYGRGIYRNGFGRSLAWLGPSAIWGTVESDAAHVAEPPFPMQAIHEFMEAWGVMEQEMRPRPRSPRFSGFTTTSLAGTSSMRARVSTWDWSNKQRRVAPQTAWPRHGSSCSASGAHSSPQPIRP